MSGEGVEVGVGMQDCHPSAYGHCANKAVNHLAHGAPRTVTCAIEGSGIVVVALEIAIPTRAPKCSRGLNVEWCRRQRAQCLVHGLALGVKVKPAHDRLTRNLIDIDIRARHTPITHQWDYKPSNAFG